MAVKFKIGNNDVSRMEFVSELEWRVLLEETARKCEEREKNIASRRKKRKKTASSVTPK